ncbi:MAG: trypsin-like peptidase domain-containing protein [Pyrinomonadaceae bacterium]
MIPLLLSALFVCAAAQPPQVVITPQQLSMSFAAAARAVEPAVVSIDTKSKVADSSRPVDPSDLLDLFNRLPRRPTYSVGSGFIVDKRGYILTNQHVVADSARINVKLDSGEEFLAKVVGVDEETDLAVLKIEAGRDLPVVKFGDSSKAQVGDWVIAIGSPFGLNRTVTAGIISQTRRETPSSTLFQRFIQTDAAINRGNSGGPLVNMNGEVIGVNSQIATTNGDFNGVGFALPSTDAANVFEQIIKYGRVRRGFLGVTLESVKPEFAKVYGMSEAKGAIVMEVRSAGGAAAAGLKSGDVIVGFDGKQVESALDLIAKVSGANPDQTVAINYLRDVGKNVLERRTATLRLGERPADPQSGRDDPVPVKLPVERTPEVDKPFGLTLSELTPDIAALYNLEGQKGVLVKEINPESYIADVKVSTGNTALDEGDLIIRINRQPATDVKAFSAIANALKPGDAVVLHILSLNPRGRTTVPRIVQFTVQ